MLVKANHLGQLLEPAVEVALAHVEISDRPLPPDCLKYLGDTRRAQLVASDVQLLQLIIRSKGLYKNLRGIISEAVH